MTMSSTSTLQDLNMQACSHCLTLVKANVYNQEFLGNLALILLPLMLLSIIVFWIYKQ